MPFVRNITLNTGSLMPMLGLGTYKIRGYDVIYSVVEAALNAGYRAIDTASVYKNEEDIGKALKSLLPKFNLTRKDIFITSKLAPGDQGAGSHEACLASIQRLGLEYLDLYLIHWPGAQGLKPDSPKHPDLRRQSWATLEKLHLQGTLKAIGVSNYTRSHLEGLLSDCKVKPAVLQIEHHPYLNQKELLMLCQEHNIHFQAYSSLGTTTQDSKLLADPVIQSVAEKHHRTPAQVLLRWANQQNIGVIPKSVNHDHIRGNINIEGFTLTEEDLTIINSLHRNVHLCWNPEAIT